MNALPKPPRSLTARLVALLTAAIGVMAIQAAAIQADPAAADTSTTTSTTNTTTASTGVTTSTTTAAPTTTAPPPSTSTTTAPAPTTTAPTTAPAPTATTPQPGVPPIPVGAPTTTTTAPPPGTPAPPPPPSPQSQLQPVLTQVDGDLAQLTAISDYQAGQTMVGRAQTAVTQAGAQLLADREQVDQAQTAVTQAVQVKSTADSKLRALALDAYVGAGYTTPGGNEPANGNGNQGFGTVSTPQGLTGIEGLDAQEMLVEVGQHARSADNGATKALQATQKTEDGAQKTYQEAQAQVTAAESALLADQQTLKIITTAATVPGAALATVLPDLTAFGGQPATGQPGTGPAGANPTGADASTQTSTPNTSTDSTTTTTVPKPATATQAANPIQAPTDTGPAPSPTIMGAPTLTATELAGWFASTGRQANTTSPIDQVAGLYDTWGHKLGLRDDIAFAQSIVETGYFSFPAGGQLTAQDNNFAGIGACDTCAQGWAFPDANTGVEAQIELLYEYANAHAQFPPGVKNVIGGSGIGGCCTTWVDLAGKWASSVSYGVSIMNVYHQMLAWVIPQRELAAGVISPTTTAAQAQGPELAPLPGSPPATSPTTSGSSTTTVKAASTP